MIKTDTLQVLKDSSKVLPTDSLAKLDSLSGVDSTQLADTVKAIIQLPRGFVGVPHPVLPQSDSWVFVTLLILFFLFVFSISRSSDKITDIAKNFFQVKDRSSFISKATLSNFRFKFFLIEFAIGIISLYAYLLFRDPSIDFTIYKFCYLLLATSLFFGLKSILFDLIGYVFFDSKTIKMAKESYFNIISLIGIILFPILIFQIYFPGDFSTVTEIISLIICIIGYILIIIKIFQIFFHKTVASFYILLYLCTLEFLPLFALYRVYQLIL